MSKLRRKFILYSFLSVAGLLVLLLGSLNVFDFVRVSVSADETLEVIASEGGAIEEPPSFGAPSKPDAPFERDRLDSIRYFTYAFDVEGNTEKIAHRMFSISEEEASAWAKSLSHYGKGWSKTYYRYLVYGLNGLTYVTLIDQSRELDPAYHFLYGSLVGAFIGLSALFLILLPVSKIFVKPIEESNKKQKRFISDASHELKTPLAIISANNEIIAISQGENEETKMIAKQVKKLNSMVKDLNALARLDEEGKKPFSPMDISFIVEEVWESFLPAFRKEKKELTLKVEPSLTLSGFEADIRKCLSIMADNALKYSKKEATLTLGKEGSHLYLKSENDMESPKEGPCDYVFERFYRSEESRASGIEGSGIGLSIYKEIIESHHGRVKSYVRNGRFVLLATF